MSEILLGSANYPGLERYNSMFLLEIARDRKILILGDAVNRMTGKNA